MPDPIYTSDNTLPAYQLDWSYSLFWHEPPQNFSWFDELKELNEKDHIRLLQHQFQAPNVSQFLISTKPSVPPRLIVQRLKGRLQSLIRKDQPNAFRRNYSLRSIGSTKRETLETYLAEQLEHHPSADTQVQRQLETYQIHNAEVDLSQPRSTSHAIYWYNLHVVLVHEGRYREIGEEVLRKNRRMILGASEAKGHLLSRAALLPDHVHLVMGCDLEVAPEDVVLSYMNNLAYVQGMTDVFKYSYYVGTFSEYDLGVIPRVADDEQEGTTS